MPHNPGWVRRNSFAAWFGYTSILVSFGTCAMALAAAASGYAGWALIAGGVCAATAITSLTIFGSTVHSDHVKHHTTPRLLMDCWEESPDFAQLRGLPAAIEPKRLQ
ncbi:hypothetical protein ACFVUS_09620 [Nocardia sp. NPDC058058]|uniref:hypothetical protein n=1 Tax=Nocardia sp. NPDC058058 TaxID=3346317 RepID=UPI0036DB2290